MEKKNLINFSTQIKVKAILKAERINTKIIEMKSPLSLSPLITKVGEEGLAAIFRYGTVVLFNVTPQEEDDLYKSLEYSFVGPVQEKVTEEIHLQIDKNSFEREEKSILYIQELDMPRVQIIADVLSKSIILEYYEFSIGSTFDSLEPLAAKLAEEKFTTQKNKELLAHISNNLLLQQKMVGRVGVQEKPDVLWYHVEIERFYNLLEDEYEIIKRHLALERKLDVISKTTDTLLQLLQHGRSIRVEWFIVILILFEILFTIFEKFGGR